MGPRTPGRINTELDNILNACISSLAVLSNSLLGHLDTKNPMAHNGKYPTKKTFP